MSEETIEIEDCPHCEGNHIYKIEVDRAYMIKAVIASDMFERSRTVEVTQFFVCPVMNERYEATFYLEDTSSSRIKNVRVVGPAEGENDG